jgi:DNA-binding ferritin-like protein (Dps family)
MRHKMTRAEMIQMKINEEILKLVNEGLCPVEALIKVIGEDAYNDMVGRLYEELRATK